MFYSIKWKYLSLFLLVFYEIQNGSYSYFNANLYFDKPVNKMKRGSSEEVFQFSSRRVKEEIWLWKDDVFPLVIFFLFPNFIKITFSSNWQLGWKVGKTSLTVTNKLQRWVVIGKAAFPFRTLDFSVKTNFLLLFMYYTVI